MNAPFSLEPKNVLVLGSRNETGEAIVRACLDFGATVVDIGPETGKRENDRSGDAGGRRSIAVEYDDFDLLAGVIREETEKHGSRFDGVVFCAGTGGVRPLSSTQPDFAARMMHANALLFIEFIRLLIKHKALNPGAGIVALSSVSASKGLKAKAAYSASKAALEGAVRSMAAELADRQIRVNAVRKGWVTSDMKLDFIRDNMALGGNEDLQRQVLGPIEPVELAYSVVFLLSDASRKITGVCLPVDGGYSL
jgi:NAD(P)-dependent dehydrogenase (short-subunit alcohol dehydrogenase family)